MPRVCEGAACVGVHADAYTTRALGRGGPLSMRKYVRWPRAHFGCMHAECTCVHPCNQALSRAFAPDAHALHARQTASDLVRPSCHTPFGFPVPVSLHSMRMLNLRRRARRRALLPQGVLRVDGDVRPTRGRRPLRLQPISQWPARRRHLASASTKCSRVRADPRASRGAGRTTTLVATPPAGKRRHRSRSILVQAARLPAP